MMDLRKLNNDQLGRIATLTEKLADQIEQDELANFGEADDLQQATDQAKDYIKRRKNNVRLIDDKENASIRKQVRSYLKRRGIIRD